MEDILYQYGPLFAYGMLLLGSFVEGESVVLTAGFLAYKGFLSLPLIILISFSGSLAADQVLFHIGRHYGPGLIERHPYIRDRAQRVFRLLHKYSTGFILGFRFVYGVRTISPLVIGASGIQVKKFTILNFLAATLWSILSCLTGYFLGYLFSDAIEKAIKIVARSQKIAILGILVAIGVLGIFIMVRKRYKKD